MLMRDKITTALKTAMKARDTDRLAALRLINAAIKDRDIAAGRWRRRDFGQRDHHRSDPHGQATARIGARL